MGSCNMLNSYYIISSCECLTFSLLHLPCLSITDPWKAACDPANACCLFVHTCWEHKYEANNKSCCSSSWPKLTEGTASYWRRASTMNSDIYCNHELWYLLLIKLKITFLTLAYPRSFGIAVLHSAFGILSRISGKTGFRSQAPHPILCAALDCSIVLRRRWLLKKTAYGVLCCASATSGVHVHSKFYYLQWELWLMQAKWIVAQKLLCSAMQYVRGDAARLEIRCVILACDHAHQQTWPMWNSPILWSSSLRVLIRQPRVRAPASIRHAHWAFIAITEGQVGTKPSQIFFIAKTRTHNCNDLWCIETEEV